MQAKFLHFYPGYNWGSMMKARKLPFAVFLSLYQMIDAVEAETALETEIPAIMAALMGKTQEIRKKLDNVFEIKAEFNTAAAKEKDLRNSFRASSAIRNAKHSKEKNTLKKKKAK